MAGYITATDLLNALSASTFLQIYDDANSGNRTSVLASAAVTLCLSRAHAEVTSYLPNIYDVTPPELPSAVSVLLKSAELDYAIALSYERHPEYVHTFGEVKRTERWLRGEKKMERIVSNIQQIAPNDDPPAAKSNTVGGIVYSSGPRTIIDSDDGTSNGGDF